MTEAVSFLDNKQLSESPEVRAQAELDSFVTNPGLSELATLFGEPELPDDPSKRLTALQEVAAQHWDFRKGAERMDVNWGEENLQEQNSEQTHIVFNATDKLGMVESSHPERDHYDFMTILGGANLSPLLRLRYGLSAGATFGAVVLLGSDRKVGPKERSATDTYAPGAVTEYDLMNGAAETLLGDRIVARDTFEIKNPEGRVTGDSKNWKVKYYELDDGTPIFSLSSDFLPDRDTTKDARKQKNRANSADTYAFMRNLAGDMLNPDAHVLNVTNAFYKPFQHLDGVRELELPTGAHVETIGFRAGYGVMGQRRTASQLLQETKGAVDAAVRLQQRIDTYVS
jgi:hypothetical protein